MKCDLHIHTDHSDGSYSVDEIISLAKTEGIQVISITDHDTVEAYQEITEEKDVHIVTGIEISCDYNGEEIHLLGYNFNEANSQLLDFLKEIKNKKISQTILFMRNIKKMKLPAGIESEILKRRIRRIDIEEAFKKYDLSPRYYQELDQILLENRENRYFPQYEKGQDIIRKAGGICLLAHPYRYFKDEKSLYHGVEQLRPDGIECYSPIHSLEYIQMCQEVARKYRLLISGGSDFHRGCYNPKLTCSNRNLTVLSNL